MHIDKPIIIILTIFIILLLIFFLVAPEYRKFKDLQSDLGIKKAEYNAEYEYYSQITQNYYNIQSNSEKIEKIDIALPSDPALANLFYYVQDQSLKNGLILKSMFLTKAPSVSEEENIKDIGFSLSLLGNYKALESFLSSLEKSSRMFEINGISFGSGSASSQENQFQSQDVFQFSMQITTHAY
ncbi:MAG: type 4a pilus biogenesis protein PilO [Candidatus Moranbacteria bacterium]|nr:type 4a pilus biogenesis protein PilO [Candidatus Moranbacteria bacterium]